MTAERDCWLDLRRRAETCLSHDFAQRVIQQARSSNKNRRREYALIASTIAFCLVSSAVANWYFGNRIQQRNLARWAVVESQIKALQTI
jgi:hypothetical protein